MAWSIGQAAADYAGGVGAALSMLNPFDPLGGAANTIRAAQKTGGYTYTAPKSSPKPQTPSPNPSIDASKASNDWARESAALNAQLNALSQQLAAQPKLPNFDILANYNRAKSTATAAVTPLYNKKLNLFLEGQGIKKETKTKEKDLGLENNAISLQNTLGDNQTSRVRTGEDLANVLASIGQQRSDFLVDDADEFDQSRRALQEEVAAGGATDTGLGQQSIQKQQDDRNLNAGRTEQQFQNQEQAKKMLATRTIDDLATSDTRSTQKKGQDDKAVQIDFEGYMKSLANEEQSFRLDNDLNMALEIARQTGSNAQQGVAEWLSGLASQGWRAQDIALASQVYRM